jgi:hypothetical protein
VIDRNTVLILGAGASCHAGFPLGNGLRELICEHLPRRDRHMAVLNSMNECSAKIEPFRERFANSGQLSIDAFLSKQPAELLDVGKAIIAACLIPTEKLDLIQGYTPKPNWYHYLLHRLTDQVSKSQFEQNRLAIITLNYDRSLEYFLYQTLQATYAVTAEEASDMVRSIPIVHVHGQLGRPHFLFDDGRPYEDHVNKQSLRTCIQDIKIVHEASNDSNEFIMARSILEQAKVICFLGFGYHDTILDRLNLGQDIVYGREFFACMTNLGDARRKRLHRRLGGYANLTLGRDDQGALEFLRQYPVLE